MMEESNQNELILVTTKPCFGLPTACPKCLPVYFYLKFAHTPFDLCFHSTFPDSDQIPYVESGSYVAYNNENSGVVECLRKDGIADLDSDFHNFSEWVSMKAMVSSWLVNALMYELWVGSDRNIVQQIYYTDLPWPIGQALYFKQIRTTKQNLGITSENAERIEAEIYNRANLAYGALSSRLGEDPYLFGDRPSSLDALFLSHALITLQALPDTSVLKGKLLSHSNLVKYTEKLSMEFIGDVSAWSSAPSWSRVSSSPGQPSSSTPGQGGFSNWSSKPKSKPKKERTEEEKKFRRRAKYFLAAQLVSVLVFLSLFGGSDSAEVELDEDEDGLDYND